MKVDQYLGEWKVGINNHLDMKY